MVRNPIMFLIGTMALFSAFGLTSALGEMNHFDYRCMLESTQTNTVDVGSLDQFPSFFSSSDQYHFPVRPVHCTNLCSPNLSQTIARQIPDLTCPQELTKRESSIGATVVAGLRFAIRQTRSLTNKISCTTTSVVTNTRILIDRQTFVFSGACQDMSRNPSLNVESVLTWKNWYKNDSQRCLVGSSDANAGDEEAMNSTDLYWQYYEDCDHWSVVFTPLNIQHGNQLLVGGSDRDSKFPTVDTTLQQVTESVEVIEDMIFRWRQWIEPGIRFEELRMIEFQKSKIMRGSQSNSIFQDFSSRWLEALVDRQQDLKNSLGLMGRNIYRLSERVDVQLERYFLRFGYPLNLTSRTAKRPADLKIN